LFQYIIADIADIAVIAVIAFIADIGSGSVAVHYNAGAAPLLGQSEGLSLQLSAVSAMSALP
jgi:hypothetical protein